MTQEQKKLLLKDLCARLPYRVKINVKGEIYDNRSCHLTDIHHGLDTYVAVPDGMQYHIENIKPYFFPLSSMTEEQKHEFIDTCTLLCYDTFGWTDRTFDWLNKNHFDFRDLIPMGLALDATGLNIY